MSRTDHPTTVVMNTTPGSVSAETRSVAWLLAGACAPTGDAGSVSSIAAVSPVRTARSRPRREACALRTVNPPDDREHHPTAAGGRVTTAARPAVGGGALEHGSTLSR